MHTDSTIMGAKYSLWERISLEFSAVPATFSSITRFCSESVSEMVTATELSVSSAFFRPARMPRMITWECIPSLMNSLAFFRISAASSTTVVVPSPTSASCAWAMSTRVLAAGWTMSRSFMMLAPSFEITGFCVVCTNLSIPRGPSVERIASATASQELMLLMICPRP